MKNKVTIIVPVYNCEEYLDACFKSIENQTLDSNLLNVVIVNDGSKDNSLGIIKQYIEKHDNWTLIDQVNQGLSASRNAAMKLNKNEYIVFLDSDDELTPNALKFLYEKIEKNNSDMVVGGMINYNSKSTFENYTTKYLRNYDNVDYEKYPNLLNFVHAQSKIYRVKSLNNLEFIKNVKHEDNYFTLSLYFRKVKIDLIDEIVYMHRVREGDNKSIMQSLSIKSFSDLLINYKKLLSENEVNYKIIKYMYKKITNYIAKYLIKKDEKEALSLFKKLINETKQYVKISPFKRLLLNIYKIEKILLVKIYNLKKGN